MTKYRLRMRGSVPALATVTVWLVGTIVVLRDSYRIITLARGRIAFSDGFGEGRLPASWLPQLSVAQLGNGSTGSLGDIPPGVRLLAATPSLIHLATVLLACLLITRIVKGISSGLPFEEPVLRSWKWLAISLVAGSTLQGMCDVAASRVLTDSVQSQTSDGGTLFGVQYEALLVAAPEWPVLYLVLGVVAASLTLAFHSGARLESEVEGVV